jgi:hypothetical protein
MNFLQPADIDRGSYCAKISKSVPIIHHAILTMATPVVAGVLSSLGLSYILMLPEFR